MSVQPALTEIKKSYFNFLSLLLEQDHLHSQEMKCLLKWSAQLKLTPEDIKEHGKDFDLPKFVLPLAEVERMEMLYHLVYIIYLDQVVEDVELEVAGYFGEKLGYSKSLVGDLFKSIATAAYDQLQPSDVRKEVLDFIKINNSRS